MATFKDTLLLIDKVTKPLENIQKSTKKVTQVTDKVTQKHNLFQKALRNTQASLLHLDRKLRDTGHQYDVLRKKTENITKLGNKIKGIGQGLTVGVTLPVIAAGGAMIKLASDMEETINKVDVSFGNSSNRVKEWAKTSVTSMGLAQQTALDSAALYGDMATGMGFAQDKAADMATSLTQLGADLASFKNISNDMAQTALKSIFTGETESLKNLGVVMTEANLQQYGLEKGMLKMVAANKKGSKTRVQRINELSQTEQVLLRYNYVMDKTKNAHGDFERTGGGAANQTRMFQEQLKELGTTFGQYILPYFTEAIKKLNKLLKSFNNLPSGVKKAILIFGGILAILGPLITIIGGVISAIGGIAIALGITSGAVVGAIGVFLGWAAVFGGIVAGIWAIVETIKALIGWIKHLNRMRINDINTNFNQQELEKLSAIQTSMGDKAFTKKYGKEVGKTVTKYRENKYQYDNRNQSTNINFYGNVTPGSGSNELDRILAKAPNVK